MRRVLHVVIASTFVAVATVQAHVGPSKDDNNRYLKVTAQTDRVRLAYTVFFGEVPGAKMRASIDADRDGVISEPEAQAFGDKLALEVAAGIDVSLDNVQRKLVFDQVVVGMGSPQVRAGSFSVDLIAELCNGPENRHSMVLRDRFRLLNPGETEVKLESPSGIVIGSAKIGQSTERVVKFVGPGGPLADDGVQLTYDVTPQAPPASSACVGAGAAAEPKRGLPPVLVIGAGALVAFLLAWIVTRVRKRG